MKIRAAVLLLLTLGILAAPLAAEAQRAGKVAQIGVLWSGSASAVVEYSSAFQQGLRERGYVEGENIVINHRYTAGRHDRLSDVIAELIGGGVDVIVTHATPLTLAAKQATTTIPIVMVGVGDPVGSRLVASLSRPGGNITGLSILAPELGGKRLELLKETLPRISRVAVLWNPANPATRPVLRETETAARALRVQLRPQDVREAEEFDVAFSAITRDRADALLVIPDPVFLNQRHGSWSSRQSTIFRRSFGGQSLQRPAR